MKIATLQFAPLLGQRDDNIERANDLLSSIIPGDCDLLVLPELAFSGYSFPDLPSITPFLEPTAAGPSTQWATATASRLACHVCIGYPELAASGQRFNSQALVSPTGEVVAHYRKSHLYYTDETWAAEGPGFAAATVPAFGEMRSVLMGICMDINSYRFEAEWDSYEFAAFGVRAGVRLVVISTAWTTHLGLEELVEGRARPDHDTLGYWLARLTPLVEQVGKEEVVVVFADRCGTEPGQVAGVTRARDENGQSVVAYAGTSCVMGFKDGKARLWDVLGRGEERVLLVDTHADARYEIARRPRPVDSGARD